MNTSKYVGLGVVALFIVGAVYIVVQGRPVVSLREEMEEASEQGSDDVGTDAVPQQPEGLQAQTTTVSKEVIPTTQPAPKDTTSITTQPAPTAQPASSTQPTEPVSAGPLTFSLSDVVVHDTAADCWSAINGSVYDLTSFVSRHPGGSSAIKSLCGIDGSSKFNKQHSRSKAAQSSLALLKIGVLK